MRKEQDIFDDLAKLCSSPGYAHAIAYLCFRDNTVSYAGDMKAEDMSHLFSSTRLIRTEISTLIGLLIKKEISYALPASSVMQQYLDKTEKLLEELHRRLSAQMFEGLDPKKSAVGGPIPLSGGKTMREPIFYSGESAYGFQYRDMSPKKYANDDEWLEANKGFSSQTARDVAHAIQEIQNEKLAATLKVIGKTAPEEWTFLPAYTLTGREISDHSGIDEVVVEKILSAFAVPKDENNKNFCALNDFNCTYAWPLLRMDDGSYILFQSYGFVQALYEAPFYWMGEDKSYVSTAMQHRGWFTEKFSRERLELVFGRENVHSNVDIIQSKGKKLGEIDVLVLFGNRAIVLQAKSKRLTLEAKRGNARQIKDDFKKSIQDSYDQGHKCAKLLVDAKYKLMNADSEEIATPLKFKEVYIFCVISDHYPALSFQAGEFLKFERTEVIQPPFVMDVFMLDALTEMLQSPIRLLSYANQRTNYSGKLHASHELTFLSYHLKVNLWIDDKTDFMVLNDDISADLDVAMAVRRDNVPGKRTPDGILTRFGATALGRFVEEIEARPDPATIDFGFMLLTLSEDTVVNVSKGIDAMARQARKDRKHHDLTVGIGAGSTGLTIHCNEDPNSTARSRLQGHCELRKYTERADSWFGVCIYPKKASLRFGLSLDHKWERNAKLDAKTPTTARLDGTADLSKSALWKKNKKTGRNDPCPCGSGIKFKKCCINR